MPRLFPPPLFPYKVTTIDARCEIAIRDVANFVLSKFISLLRRDIFYVCPYTSPLPLLGTLLPLPHPLKLLLLLLLLYYF